MITGNLGYKYKQFIKKLNAEITQVPEILQPSYLQGLDGLRAVSIIIVLLGHALIGTWWVEYFPGSIGVSIFFVISGFLITTLLLKEKVNNGKVSLSNFYFRRVLRIFPVAYLYLLFLVILNHVFDLNTTLRMFLTAGLYVGNFPVQYGSNWQTAHFWSLAVEEQFYLLFPFILVRSINWYLVLLAAILLSLPFIIIFGGFQKGHHLLNTFILSLKYLLGYGTASILFGSLASIALFKGMISAKTKPHYYLSLIVLTVAILAHITGVLNWYIMIYIFPILISYVIILNLQHANFLLVILSYPIVKRIGVLSYSIYIWQQLFTHDQPWKGLFKYSNSLLLNGVALILVSYLSYTLYESKFLKLKRRFVNTAHLDKPSALKVK